MTTLRTPPESKLGIKLQNYRADRPDEWTMDDFTREAEIMNEQNKALESLSINQWINVEDRLPKQSCFVIVRSVGSVDSKYSTGTVIAYFSTAIERGRQFQSQSVASHITCSHWMTLPEPPK